MMDLSDYENTVCLKETNPVTLFSCEGVNYVAYLQQE